MRTPRERHAAAVIRMLVEAQIFARYPTLVIKSFVFSEGATP